MFVRIIHQKSDLLPHPWRLSTSFTTSRLLSCFISLIYWYMRAESYRWLHSFHVTSLLSIHDQLKIVQGRLVCFVLVWWNNRYEQWQEEVNWSRKGSWGPLNKNNTLNKRIEKSLINWHLLPTGGHNQNHTITEPTYGTWRPSCCS